MLIVAAAPAPARTVVARSAGHLAVYFAYATLVLTLVGAGVAVSTYPQIAHPSGEMRDGIFTSVSYAVPYGLTGAFLVLRRPDLVFGWLLSATAILVSVEAALLSAGVLLVDRGGSSVLAAAGLLLSGFMFLPVAVQGLVNLRFPSGRITSPWARSLEIAIGVGIALGLLSGALGDQPTQLAGSDGTTHTLVNPLTAGTAVGQFATMLEVAVPLVILLGLVAGLGVVRRAWTARGAERDQLRWRAYGVVAALALFPLAVNNLLPTLVSVLDGLLFVATLVIPIVRYRLWAIDTIIRRSVAYVLVTIVIAAAFAAIAAVGTMLAGERVGLVVAAAAIALTFAPALGRVQRWVDQLFYGRRNDPYQVLTDLGRRLEAVAAPGEVLPAVVTAAADSLRLPYVAIERAADAVVLAASGVDAPDRLERWPLTYRSNTVGQLVAAPRAGEISFTERDRTVLADLARQAGAAVHAEALTADLLESRQRLVAAREEERRRLRRDLHDGLGPLLTGIGLTLDAARARLADADPRAVELVTTAKDASARAITDLRGIVYGLRPQALDDLGLVGAITAHARRLGEGTPVEISIDADALPELPAAVEVAVFRVTVEALTNVVRHATAARCSVRLNTPRTAEIAITISDDGCSSGPWRQGVGLLAMRERVTELGGDLEAGPLAGGGGSVVARIPLPRSVS
ncbi:sensor histidine kinase [Cryptosporangium sp. NPDC051539]|uniref:sensor histidine kinase n=1 Tax=Cryptosporangium sp. NPDC051539 TaxID=3363962 RepID=UPI0037B737F1